MASAWDGSVTHGVGTTGPVFVYEVRGLPSGDSAQLREVQGRWSIHLWRGSAAVPPTTDYATADEALAALRFERR